MHGTILTYRIDDHYQCSLKSKRPYANPAHIFVPTMAGEKRYRDWLAAK